MNDKDVLYLNSIQINIRLWNTYGSYMYIYTYTMDGLKKEGNT